MTVPLRWTPLGWAALAALAPWAALADTAAVRVADHPGFGRVVFEFAAPTPYEMAVDGDRVILVFDGAPVIGPAGAPPRNVRLMQGGTGSATLVLSPGARARAVAMGNRVVLDIMDPARDPPRMARAAASPAMPFRPAPPPGNPAPPEAAPAIPVQQDALPGPAAALLGNGSPARGGEEPAGVRFAPSVRAGQEAVPRLPSVLEPPPASQAGQAAAMPSTPAGPASQPSDAGPSLASLVVPLDAGVGAAALRRGAVALVVFDSPAAVDEARLRRLRGFEQAVVTTGPAATVVQVPAPPDGIGLAREARGWRIAAKSAPSAAVLVGGAGAAADPGGGVLVALAQPGRTVAVADPATGGALLVGTANPPSGAAAYVQAGLNAPGAAVLPTWAGVAVEPFADDVVLRAAPGGFVLGSSGVSASPAMPAVALTRRFDFPNQPVPALLQRLRAAAGGAAAAAPRARSAGRLATAQAMISLGLGAEAASVLALAAADDPAAAASPDLLGLSAIAALLAGRLDGAAGLDAPGLDGSDEAALWRGVRDAMLGRQDAAARALPSLMPLALSYPAPLQDRILPIIAEAAVQAGQPLPALPDLPALAYARALQLERDGKLEAALDALDALASGRDQLDQVRAGARAAELRLGSGRMDAAAAGAAMTRLVAAWRGDMRELSTRLRAAELFGQAGAWRTALDLLRETSALFPDAGPALRARMAGVFGTFLSNGQAVPPAEVVTLVADFAELVPAGTEVAGLLTDKLLDLDLTDRARVLLQARVAAAPPGLVRAGLGHRLAMLQLEGGDGAAAERTLATSEAEGVPERLALERALLRAKVRAGRGDPAGAAGGLSGLAGPAADDLRARLLEQAGDWRGAGAALDSLAAHVLPTDGPIPDTFADLIMRRASAAVQAGDAGVLRDLNARYAGRMSGPRREVFRLLTAAPVAGTSDLPRAAGEIALARAVPAGVGGR